MGNQTREGPGSVVERVCQAVNKHDLPALVDCFALNYRNETPAHPARGFEGRTQVEKNWQQIFAAVPDISAQVKWIADESTAWSEWEMRGTLPGGSPHHMRGVVIFGVDGGEATWARFYLEPVEEGGAGPDDTIRAAVAAGPGPESTGRQR